MTKYTLKVEGMQCAMCESHVDEAVRQAVKVRKVSSSHRRGETVAVAEEAGLEEALRAAIDATGYQVLSVRAEPYEKTGFFAALRK